ncbi:hypothetical protein ACA910_004020 [Epithemia clementina (nom. ined.)]
MSHRGRRQVGVAGRNKQYVQKKADEMKAIGLQNALDTLEKLEVKLSEFAKRHQSEIQNDPVFRERFLQMCAPLGVDPLASKKSFWGQLLGMGDFYHELAVKVAEVCLAAKARNGGIMSLTEVQSILAKRKTKLGMTNSSSQKVSKADLQVAISKLSQLGGGFRTVQVGKSTMVISVPTELDNDHMQVMTAASAFSETGLSVDNVMHTTQWSRERTQRALDLLLQQGMAWLDTYEGQDLYWFPSIWQENRGGSGFDGMGGGERPF